MKKLIRCSFSFLILLPLFLLAAGCGGKGESGEAMPGDEAAVESGDSLQTVSIDIESSTDDKMFLKEFIPFVRAEDAAGVVPHRYYDTYGSCFYLIEEYKIDYDSEDIRHFYVFDGETGKLEERPFPLETPERPGSAVVSMDILPDGTFSLRMSDYTTDGTFYVKADAEGNVLTMQKDFPEREKYPWNPLSYKEEKWKVFDFEDGSTLIGEPDSEKTKFSWFDAETGSKKAFGELEGEMLQSVCKDGEDAFYCNLGSRLVRWDLKANTCEMIVNLYKKGIGGVFEGNNMLLNQAGEIIICATEGESPGIYVFSGDREQIRENATLQLVRLQTYGMEYVSSVSTKFFTLYPNCAIETSMEDDPARSQDFHDRLFVEIVAGNAPDLMWVSEEDMRILGEKGALMDLSDMIPEDIKVQLFPGVLQLGTVDGRLVGITPEVSFESMVTADAVWPDETWSVKDFLNLAEERKDAEWLMGWGNMQLSPNYLLNSLFLSDYSELIDWEQGTCNFDSDEFKRMLELSKKYGLKTWVELETEERQAMLKDGAILATGALFYEGIENFFRAMKTYNDGFHFVGYPTASGGSGNYIYSEGYLVVSAKTEHVQEIKDFIALLLDYDNQYTTYISSVRRDVSRDCVTYYMNKPVQKLSNTSEIPTVKELPKRPGGGTYIEEYLAFAESCVPRPYKPEAISNILSEELPGYFEGNRSAEEVAGVIQNRVRLYLMENE